MKWLGPTPEQIIAFGLKHEARRLAGEAGVPLVPGTGSVGERGSGGCRREGNRLSGHAQKHRGRRRHRHEGLPR